MKVKKDILLKNLTTFKVGGKARYVIEVVGNKELLKAVKFAKEKALPVFVLGEGSDILVSDKDFDAVVIRLLGDKIKITESEKESRVSSESGVSWDHLVDMVVEKGLSGMECLSGIPGTVGAAPIQNIGAYGQELKDTFHKLIALDVEKGKLVEFDKKDCQFSYRESIFKKPENKGRYIITKVHFILQRRKIKKPTYESLATKLKSMGTKDPSVKDIREAVLSLRGERLEDPKKIGNAGSFFKNPVVSERVFLKIKDKHPDVPYFKQGEQFKLFSGWFIEKAGWKGKSFKSAKVSERNALVLVNPGKAKSSDIKRLAEKIQSAVQKEFGIELEPEVQFINY